MEYSRVVLKCRMLLLLLSVALAVSSAIVKGNGSDEFSEKNRAPALPPQTLMVGKTLLRPSPAHSGYSDTNASVCLDGTLPAYHFHPGSGSGSNSWLVHLEGGGWCNSIRSCIFRKTTRRGSSKLMENQLPFTGILSNKHSENPDFYNWNRVKLRYCDGASFLGDSQNEASQLYFRGQRIWLAAMEELMSKGMKNATQALLSGCSAGGLASILHCDQFQNLFPSNTKVKCLSDAGYFLDATDVSSRHTLRNLYSGVVSVEDLQNNLPRTCTNHLDPTSCFFPQNLVAEVKTPLFILNAAYDSWQVHESLTPSSADPRGFWKECRRNLANCNATQIQFLQDFRTQMISSLKSFSTSNKNGMFINSCFAHCQSEIQDTWFADDSPRIGDKRIAESVGEWYFDRRGVMVVDCPYPCDTTCHNSVVK